METEALVCEQRQAGNQESLPPLAECWGRRVASRMHQCHSPQDDGLMIPRVNFCIPAHSLLTGFQTLL